MWRLCLTNEGASAKGQIRVLPKTPDKKVGDQGEKKTQAKSQERLTQCGTNPNARKKNYREMEGAL